eukprot:CAMPEP_0114984578 /NCGR_PEP_ID=MMETSP0216-20121206/7353_1 /TAXON_ID=223996 /ORGANISM="Protocruzia adherens, Strain Boccale" /LENGTH=265 /DNA_ID=CAMNT_0002346727 /DNA_START=110 /DNA_END=907 /DNA_ORIENTATION=+
MAEVSVTQVIWVVFGLLMCYEMFLNGSDSLVEQAESEVSAVKDVVEAEYDSYAEINTEQQAKPPRSGVQIHDSTTEEDLEVEYGTSDYQEDDVYHNQQRTYSRQSQSAGTRSGAGIMINGQPLVIQYCVSCSYKGMFQDFQQKFRYAVPELTVVGENYPAGTMNELISTLISRMQWVAFILLLFGNKIFAYFQITPPGLYYRAQENKFFAGFMIFMLGNNLANMFLSTGAFEISYQGELVWSKLQAGGVPEFPDLLNLLQQRFPA